jgi:hypothetical protein
MFPALTCLAALAFGAAPEAEPLYVEVTFFEQRPTQAKYFIAMGKMPLDAVAIETITTKTEPGKQFSVQTRAGKRHFRIVGTILKPVDGKSWFKPADPTIVPPPATGFTLEIETACRFEGSANRLHTSAQLALNERMTIGGLLETTVSTVRNGFFGLNTAREETSVSRGCTIRLTGVPPPIRP